MNKKGFTLVELIAAIVIISLISLLAVPNVIKSFNKSRREAMVIQETKLLEAGDIFLVDYCKDAITEDYKKQCVEYYRELKTTSTNKELIKPNKTYKYICVKDIKKLKYYEEELEYSGSSCQGAIIYEIDNKTKLQTDAYSYVSCGEKGTAYRTEGKDIQIETLFKDCFTNEVTKEEKTYTVTIKFTENDVYGKQIKPSQTKVLTSEDYKNGTFFTIEATKYSKSGTLYEPVMNKHGKQIVLVDENPQKDQNGTKTFKIKKLPEENLTITIVYSVYQHNILANYYKYSPGEINNHANEKMSSKEQTITYTGFQSETKKIDIPQVLNENVNGINEKFNLAYIYVNNTKTYDIEDKNKKINNQIDIGDTDKTIDIIYQREEFNITYNNNGGTGCTTGRVKYNKPYGTLCTPTKKGYTFAGWSLTDGGSKINTSSNNTNYKDITLYAIWKANTYKITYHVGNGTSEAGIDVIKTQTCTYEQMCQLELFSTLGTPFPYSYQDEQKNGKSNYGWSFAGWTNYKDTIEIKYANGLSFIYNKAYNLDLFAIGTRNLHINGGVASTTSLHEIQQTWNPYSTNNEYLTNVTLPSAEKINGWTFVGYKAGSSIPNSTVTFDSSKIGEEFKISYDVWPYIRSVYKRTLTFSYNANGGTGTTASQTNTQYYNSGYGKNNENVGAKVSTTTFKLPENNFSRPGYLFDEWSNKSSGGTLYTTGQSIDFAPEIDDTITEKIYYANWKIIKYTITYNLNGGTNSDDAKTSYYVTDETYTLPTPTREGYSFIGWYKESDFQSKVTKIASGSTGNKTLYAKWEAKEVNYVVKHYQQKINAGDDQNTTNYTLKETETLTAATDSMIKPSVKTYTGFTAPSKKEVKIKADGSTTVNYYYKRNKYTLTLELGDDEISSTSGSGTYYYGEKTTIKATPSSYHNFDKWTLSGDEISTKSEDEYQMPAKNVTLKAYGKNAQIAQALYIKETDDNPYSLIFVYSANHYQKDDVYTYTKSDGEKKELLVNSVYKNFINDNYTSAEEVDWKNIAKYIEVVQVHGKIKPISTAFWFDGFVNCKSLYLEKLDTSNVTTMKNMFYGTGSDYSLKGKTFKIVGLNDFDTSKVTNMTNMFNKAGRYASTFDIGELNKKKIELEDGTEYTAWNTKNVKNMQWMFYMTGLHAKNFTLGNITNWNVSNVTNMKGMFAYAGYYSDTWSIGTLSLWDTSQVESMNQMFNQAGANKDAIKNLNLEDWDVTKVVDKNDYEHETYNEKTWPQYCWFENGDGVRNRTGIVAPKAFKIKNYDEYCYPVSYEKHQENIN